MAPTASPTLVHSSNSPSERHLHHLRHQALGFSNHPPGKISNTGTEEFKPRTLDPALQPSIVPEGPSPPPFVLAAPTESVAQDVNQPGDEPGNIVAAVILTVLVFSGLIGLFVGGAMLRRQTTAAEQKSSPPSRVVGRRKSKSTKNTTGSPQQRIKMGHEKFPYDEKTLTPLTQPPPPVLHKERQQRLTDVWPIRGLSRALWNRRPCSEQVKRSRQPPAVVASPQTTWSEFTPVSLYVAPHRSVLARIPEEHEEDCQSQSSSGVGASRVTHRRSIEADSVVLAPETKQRELSRNTILEVTTERGNPQDRQITYAAETREEDAKSLGSSAPDMTSDGGESSRSSIVSLESLEDRNDGESLREGVFELRRAQTKSMQVNKGVLLSLSLKTLPDHESTHGELGCSPSRSPSIANAAEGDKDYDVERELSLAMFGGSFSAVNLDEFPSPPLSLLPVIPSLVSGF